MAKITDLPVPHEVDANYSGRSMFGKTPVAVIVTKRDEPEAITWLRQHYESSVTTDDMGRDRAVIYDPHATHGGPRDPTLQKPAKPVPGRRRS